MENAIHSRAYDMQTGTGRERSDANLLMPPTRIAVLGVPSAKLKVNDRFFVLIFVTMWK
jgi:hypothetical protein